jgi:hypothetical protein
MAKSSSSKDAVDPAHHGPGGAGVPSGNVGNVNLGSVGAVSRGGVARGRKPKRVLPLRAHLDALYHDVIGVSEAARRWFDGPGRLWSDDLSPPQRLAVSMEALGVTTRLVCVMNWLLHPVHDGEVTALQPIDCPEPPPLPADHPLLATEGGPIAMASRQALARAHQLIREHGDTP